MGKLIKLGVDEPIFQSNITISKYDESGEEHVIFSDKDDVNGLMIQTDMTELAEAVANLGNQTNGKVSAADFLKSMVKNPDILDDQVFDIAKVALKACLSRVSKQEGMYYHPLAAAMAVCEDIIQNQ